MTELTTHAAARPAVAAAQRVVLKLGTRVLTNDGGRIALARLAGIVETAAELRTAGREVLIVSSGAVALGRDVLGLAVTPSQLEARRACAAVGQTRLMGLWQDAFAHFGLTCGQVLLTSQDFDDRARYLALRSTLRSLLARGVVPILNENDAVAAGERHAGVFGDNDRLSALVAAKLDADLLVLLTDVEGVYDRNPRCHDDARLVPQVESAEFDVDVAGRGSGVGRGGMQSKVEAAQIAARGGCQAVVASGRAADHLARVLAGEEVGTWFPARGVLAARRRWIAFAAAARGALHLDAGAVEALRHRGASLLSAGVVKMEGEFRAGDVVELRGPDGATIGRGCIPWSAADVRAWRAGAPRPGAGTGQCLIRRHQFVLED